MNEVKKLLLGVLAAFIVAFLVYHFVTDRAELVLHSTPVFSTSFSDPNTDYFQQSFTVRNKGNKAATSIVFLSDSEVVKYEVLQASSSDEVNRAKNPKKMDFEYTNLNPGAEFTVIALFEEQEPNTPIVTHSEGIVEASGADDVGVVFWGLLGTFILFIFVNSLTSARFEWISHIYIVKSTSFFSLKKPWYITERQYNKLLDWSIEIAFMPIREFYRVNFSDFESLKKAAETEEYINNFSNEYRSRIINKIDSVFLIEAKIAILEIDTLEALESWYAHKKPMLVSDRAWDSYLTLLNRHRDVVLQYGMAYTDEPEIQIISTLKKNKVEGLTHSQFLNHKEKLEKALYLIIVAKIIQRYQGYAIRTDLISSESIDYIKLSDKEHLEELIYAINILKADFLNPQWIIKPEQLKEKLTVKPTWINDESWCHIKNLYSQVITNFDLTRELEEIKYLLNDLFNMHTEEITFTDLKELLSELVTKKEDIEKTELQIKAAEVEWFTKTESVQKKLDFVSKILAEPETVERQEYPENLFKKQNWENLEKVASILLKSEPQ